jgi:DNA-binding NtrC family response regulator
MSDDSYLDDELMTMKHGNRALSVAELAYDVDVVDGPDRGMRFTLDVRSAGRVLIGQSPVCDIKLTDRAASRRHASLELTERGLRLTDLGSTNGTFIGALPIVQLFLQGGETIGIGKTKLHFQMRRVSVPPPSGITPPDRFGRLLGASLEMRRIYPLCERLAKSNAPVVIEGETGTGKEALAESLHECSDRAAGPFVVFDCSSVAPSEVEAALLGQEKGPGNPETRKGLFEQAHGGTLLIDEIGELDLSIQPKLLRAIERSQIRRVGGDQPIQVDVRILATTRRDLDREVLVGRFRDDLFHRLAVGRIEMPPLRRRREDIPMLVQHFCTELGTDQATMETRVLRQLRRWQDDPWPGNVRELRNAVTRQLTVGDLPIEEEELPVESEPGQPVDFVEKILSQRLPFGHARARVLSEFRTRYVRQALADQNGNVARAAASSGIGRRYFQRIKSKTNQGSDDTRD